MSFLPDHVLLFPNPEQQTSLLSSYFEEKDNFEEGKHWMLLYHRLLYTQEAASSMESGNHVALNEVFPQKKPFVILCSYNGMADCISKSTFIFANKIGSVSVSALQNSIPEDTVCGVPSGMIYKESWYLLPCLSFSKQQRATVQITKGFLHLKQLHTFFFFLFIFQHAFSIALRYDDDKTLHIQYYFHILCQQYSMPSGETKQMI